MKRWTKTHTHGAMLEFLRVRKQFVGDILERPRAVGTTSCSVENLSDDLGIDVRHAHAVFRADVLDRKSDDFGLRAISTSASRSLFTISSAEKRFLLMTDSSLIQPRVSLRTWVRLGRKVTSLAATSPH
jgi:hypothetical protein